MQTPSRPSRSLTTLSRVVRRGWYFYISMQVAVVCCYRHFVSLISFLSGMKQKLLTEVVPFFILTEFFITYVSGIESFTGSENPGVDTNGNAYDFTTKLLHLAWHPTENSIACAAANSLYMYYA